MGNRCRPTGIQGFFFFWFFFFFPFLPSSLPSKLPSLPVLFDSRSVRAGASGLSSKLSLLGDLLDRRTPPPSSDLVQTVRVSSEIRAIAARLADSARSENASDSGAAFVELGRLFLAQNPQCETVAAATWDCWMAFSSSACERIDVFAKGRSLPPVLGSRSSQIVRWSVAAALYSAN